MATDASSGPILALDGVVAGYGPMIILNQTTFDVRSGAITTIVGPNGAGKSTVFKAVFGVVPVKAGRVRFAGQDVTNLTPRRLLDLGLTYVPQGRNIFPELSVRHNLELGGVTAKDRAAVRRRIDGVMDRFQMLRRKADAQASTLSCGEQKLLEIARAMLLEPKLMLIDEASIGLSPLLVRELFGIVRGLRDSGVAILMVEQNAKSALEISDDGIVLELGRVRVQDSARAILDDPRIGQLFLGGTTAETGGEEATA